MQNTEKICLVCNSEMKEKFLVKNKLNFTNDIEEADCLIIADGTNNYDEYVNKAKELDMRIVYLDEQGRNKTVYAALFSNNKTIAISK